MTEQDMRRVLEIKGRLDRIGTRRWFYVDSPECIHRHTVAEGNQGKWTAVCAMTYASESGRRDAEFIAHARQDVPWLLHKLDEKPANETSVNFIGLYLSPQRVAELHAEFDKVKAIADAYTDDDYAKGRANWNLIGQMSGLKKAIELLEGGDHADQGRESRPALSAIACPNCGCGYETARELREWKDEK